MDIVNVIVPLAGRILTFKRFVRNFIQVYRQDDRLTLTVVLFPNHSNQTVSEIEIIMKEFSGTKNILQVDGKFSRGTALQQSSLLFNNSSLLFFLDVDMLFTEQVLHRVRSNTIFKQQVYYPIVFSQYQNSLKKLITKNESIHDQEFGYWRQFGYGIVSVYNQDLISVGGYDTNINGWGMEDVNLYDRFIASNLTIFRSADPDLIHIYHAIHCDNKLSSIQYEMCLGTKFFSLDSINTISTFIQQNHLLLD